MGEVTGLSERAICWGAGPTASLLVSLVSRTQLQPFWSAGQPLCAPPTSHLKHFQSVCHTLFPTSLMSTGSKQFTLAVRLCSDRLLQPARSKKELEADPAAP